MIELALIRRYRDIIRRLRRNTAVVLQHGSGCRDLGLGQCEVLMAIEQAGSTSLIGLVEVLGLDKSTLSRTVESLLQRGLVSRKSDPRDRRYLILSLTAKGRRLCDAINGINDEHARRTLSRFPSGHHESLVADLSRLVEALDQTTKELGGDCSGADD